jgi:hypothetical protein
MAMFLLDLVTGGAVSGAPTAKGGSDFRARVADGFREFKEQATDCTAGLLSGLGPVDLPAPYQNDQTRAVCKALGAGGGLVGDALLVTSGAAEIGGGVALSATGVGALAGVPISAAGATQIVAGTAGALVHGNNFNEALTEMRSAENRGSGSRSNGSGGSATRSKGGNGPNGAFEEYGKHGPVTRGDASRGPTNGQTALDNSVRIKDTSPHRVGVDKANKEIVMLNEHLPGKFHGHVREFGDLSQEAQNALRKSGLVNARGKIVP